jgi:transcriptional antiterminator RfaH
MKDSHKGWHILYVKSRHEKKVHESLKKISIDTFLPIVKELRKRSDRRIIIDKPLFPSYVFVNVNSLIDFHKVLTVNGACTYIRFGIEYAKVPEQEINKIKILVGDKYITNIEIVPMLPKIGALMEITYGPLSGLQCKVLKVKKEHKIIVQIESLQHNITATIPSCYADEIER